MSGYNQSIVKIIFSLNIIGAFFGLNSCGSENKKIQAPELESFFKPTSASKPCGPSGSYVSSFVPETWTGFCGTTVQQVQFTSACEKHDTCYETSGALKPVCDSMFLNHLKEECSFKFKESNCKESLNACNYVSQVYYEQVESKGQDAFNKAQQPNTGAYIQ
jgi:hypothetical protein